MRITIHRGTKEIGGSCIEAVTSNTRLVIDLGLPLVDADREPFNSRAALAKSNEVLAAEGIIPSIAGLFDEESVAPDGVLLSHAHLDHSGLLHRSRSTVPIFATRGTSKMMLAASIFAGQQELNRSRFREVIPGREIQIGNFRVTPLSMNHSIFGNVAFLIEADGKTLFYSGDFRNHGRSPEMMQNLVEHLSSKSIDVAIVEGTHFGTDREPGRTEMELQSQMTELIATAPALVLAAFSVLDRDRLVSVYHATRASGRVLVLDVYAAFVLYLLGRESGIPQSNRDQGIRVYYNELFERRKLETIRRMFFSERIELDEILAEPSRHVMVFRPSIGEFDFQGRLPERCRCLYGYWKGYLTKPDWVKLQQQIADSHGDFIPAHVSGHAYITDIVRLVKTLNPRTVIPIHTFEPQRFREHLTNVTTLTDGVSFEIV